VDHEPAPGRAADSAISRLEAAAANAIAVASLTGGNLEQARTFAAIAQVLHGALIDAYDQRAMAVLRLRAELQMRRPVSLREIGEMISPDNPLTKARVWQIIRAAQEKNREAAGE
jgi:DNA-directed RNA polymerase sigma subunit (sigma70/sigma32)